MVCVLNINTILTIHIPNNFHGLMLPPNKFYHVDDIKIQLCAFIMSLLA